MKKSDQNNITKQGIDERNSRKNAIVMPMPTIKHYDPVSCIANLFNESKKPSYREACLRYLLQYQHYNADFTETESNALGYPIAVCAPQEKPGYWRTEFNRQLEVLVPWLKHYLKKFTESFDGAKKNIQENYFVGNDQTLDVIIKLYECSHVLNSNPALINSSANKKEIFIIRIDPFAFGDKEVFDVIADKEVFPVIADQKKLMGKFVLFEIATDGVNCKLYCGGLLVPKKINFSRS